MEHFHDIALVIPSCDKYCDVWEPLLANLRHQWPDNPLKIYLISNHKDFFSSDVEVIKVGEDITWSRNLKAALKQIPENAIFLWIDDLFLKRPVKNDKMVHFFRRFQMEDMNYLRFNPTPGPVGTVDKDGIGFVPPGDLYRSSTVVCLWKKQVLIDVLKDDETAWELELLGSKRTDKFGDWYSSRQWLLPTRNLIIKGKIDPWVYWTLKKQKLPLSDKRPLMNIKEFMVYQFVKFRSWIFSFIPREQRRSLREHFMSAN